MLWIPRLQLFVEPANTASMRTAQQASFVQNVAQAFPYPTLDLTRLRLRQEKRGCNGHPPGPTEPEALLNAAPRDCQTGPPPAGKWANAEELSDL